MINFCKRCLYNETHPLNLTFDQDGICSGCRVHEEKDHLDWREREEKLRVLLEQYRCKSGDNYDCIVPVSGARDSYFIVHLIKNKFKMNPLLVSYNKHYNTDIGVRNLANLRIKFNCDIITKTVNPNSIKKITRQTLFRFGSLYWHSIAGETVFPVQASVQHKIPLIIWGAHQGVDQVGMFSHCDEVEMTRKYRKEHDLMGFEAEDLFGEMENLTEEQLSPFYYPEDNYIQSVGVRGIYLNNYVRWDSRTQHEKMIKLYKYETSLLNRTFDMYNDVDSYIYMELHDLIKDLKHGYTKVLDHACRDIRLGHLTRSEAIALVRYYQFKKPKNIKLFLEWLGIKENELNYILDSIRNKDIWERNKNWEWVRKVSLVPRNKGKKKFTLFRPFIKTTTYKSSDSKKKYILIGRGKRI
jgi:N-acetyl sugar amidotransferase